MVPDEEICITRMLSYAFLLRSEHQKLKNKGFEYGIQNHAHNVSGFGRFITSKNLTCEPRNAHLIRTGNCIISLKIFQENVLDTHSGVKK